MSTIAHARRNNENMENATIFRGAKVAFTGRLASMTRRRAHELLREAGGTPTSSISRRTTHLVVGMRGLPLRSDGSLTARLAQAERLREQGARIDIISEARFLEMLGLRDDEPAFDKSYTLDRVAEIVGVEPRTIEQWDYLGLVRSDDGHYDFQDIVSLQAVAKLVQDGVPPQVIQRSLESLQSSSSSVDRPLAQLQIIASDTGELLAQVGDALIAPDGQQLIDFNHRPPQLATDEDHAIDEWDSTDPLERAMWLEEEERYDDAIDMYRRAILESIAVPEAFFNLGNVLRMVDRNEAAEEMYRMALAADPGNELAWYNLADALEELEQFDEAIEALRRAISVSPAFADAHFNLASCLEHIGRLDEARTHWKRYIQLDPASEWTTIARRHLARCS